MESSAISYSFLSLPPSLSFSACLPGGGDDEELSQKLEHCAQADFLRMVQWRI